MRNLQIDTFLVKTLRLTRENIYQGKVENKLWTEGRQVIVSFRYCRFKKDGDLVDH